MPYQDPTQLPIDPVATAPQVPSIDALPDDVRRTEREATTQNVELNDLESYAHGTGRGRITLSDRRGSVERGSRR